MATVETLAVTLRHLAVSTVTLFCTCVLQVDAGSDEEHQLLAGLPTTEAALSAAERQSRQQPLLALSRGYQQRRVTLGDDRQQYDDEAAAAAGGVPSPRWDLHSVAESMQQVGCHGWSVCWCSSVRVAPLVAPVVKVAPPTAAHMQLPAGKTLCPQLHSPS